MGSASRSRSSLWAMGVDPSSAFRPHFIQHPNRRTPPFPHFTFHVAVLLFTTALLCLRQVELDPNSGVFITLNPAGKGYGGRQKLPDNLKQLFRPVAMTRPDNELIAEVILYSEGFRDGEMLGRKLAAIFNLAR